MNEAKNRLLLSENLTDFPSKKETISVSVLGNQAIEGSTSQSVGVFLVFVVFLLGVVFGFVLDVLGLVRGILAFLELL